MKIVGKKSIGYNLGYTYYALGNRYFCLLITHYTQSKQEPQDPNRTCDSEFN